MKRLFLFLLAALFGLGCIGCAPAQNNDAMLGALSKIMQEVQKQSPASEQPTIQTPVPKEEDPLLQMEWAQTLTGWWVEVGDVKDPNKPNIHYFKEDGRIFLSEEAYSYSLDGQGLAEWRETDDGVLYEIEAQWTLIDGVPHLIEHVYYPDADTKTQVYGCIEINEYGTMWIYRDNDMYSRCERNIAPPATAILLMSDYYYLAENARHAIIKFGKNLSEREAYITLWVNDVVRAAEDDEEYSIYDEDPTFIPVTVIRDGLTGFRIYVYNEYGFMTAQTVDFETFKEHVEAFGEKGMLVRYSPVDDYGCIFAIMEEYMP